MFPIRDHNPSTGTPFVTYALIAANFVVFAFTWSAFSGEAALAGFYADWAMIPARISNFQGWPTLVSSMFIHAGLMHIAGNMLFLWIFGDNLEEALGHFGFLVFYIICGVGAGLAHWIGAPMSGVPTVGASGAIAGVMGGYLVLFPKARVDILLIFIVFYKIVTIPAWAMLIVWFGVQLISGSLSDTVGGGVAYWAHAGGFVIGFVYVIPQWIRRGGQDYWRATDGAPPHPAAEYTLTRSRIPRVVKK